jgi:hypothetical protein
MANLVLVVSDEDRYRDLLEPLAESTEPGEEWSVADRHVVTLRLNYGGGTIDDPALKNGFTCDLGCVDDHSVARWGTRPYNLFSTSGNWDEAEGLRILDVMTDWVRWLLPSAELLQAGLDIAGDGLVLLPEDGKWTISQRY